MIKYFQHNFLLSKEQSKLLKKTAKKLKVSESEVIRGLIDTL